MSSPPSTLHPDGLKHARRHRVEGDDDLESLLRLAQIAEKDHSSLTGIGPNDHHVPTPNIAEGDYTTWTIQGIYDTGVNVDTGMMGHDFVGIRNDGRVIWHDDSAFTSYIISPGGESVGYSSRHTES